jgi:regulator of RNase E activity RraA
MHPGEGAEDDRLLARARELPTAILSDAAGGAGVPDPGIAALTPQAELCGRALTAECARGDVLGSMVTLLGGKPGEVLVVGGLDAPLAVLGGFMMRACLQLELGGAVLDGYVRDADEIAESGFPVFCRGATPRIATERNRGRSRVPIRCGGVGVAPGDLVRGDRDGVVFVPWADLPDVLERAEAKAAKEEQALALMRDGAGLEVLYGEYLSGEGEGQ